MKKYIDAQLYVVSVNNDILTISGHIDNTEGTTEQGAGDRYRDFDVY